MLQIVLDGASTILSLAISQAFTWAVTGHFKSDRIPTGMRLILLASTITGLAMLVLLWTNSQPPVAQFAGMAIEVCGLGLFLTAITATRRFRFRLAFDDGLPDQLVMSGPYRYIRHPFYTSYLIFWAGFAMMTYSWLSLPLLVVMTTIYSLAARDEDRRLASSNMAEQHALYRQQAGMFWPKLPARRKPVAPDAGGESVG
jgi:protein-S-isoprenylcysteine O-methyltransferase Ste14